MSKDGETLDERDEEPRLNFGESEEFSASSTRDSGSPIQGGGTNFASAEKPQMQQQTFLPRRARAKADESRIEELFKTFRVRILISLWVLGVINNFHYNLVISAANSLAGEYNMKHLVALISFSNVFFGIAARIVNAFFASRVSFNARMTFMVTLTVTGLLFTAFSGPIGGYNDTTCFFIVILGVCCSGTAYSYGECVALTYMQRYPSFVVGSWGSGTGASGVITSVLYIILTNNGVSKEVIFLASAPLTIVYWLAFCVGLVAPHRLVDVTHQDGRVTEHVLLRGKEDDIYAKLSEETGVEIGDYHIEMLTNLRGLSWHSIPRYPFPDRVKETLNIQDDPEVLHCSCCNCCLGSCSPKNPLRHWWHCHGSDIVFVHKTMWWFYVNVAAVYVCEYSAQFMAPFSFKCQETWEGNFFVRNSYPITQVCYQVGVFLSRTSLTLFHIPYVGVLSIIQLFNAILWFVQAKTLFIGSSSVESTEVGVSFILFALMLFVGLVGGASYVNCFFLMLDRSLKLQEVNMKSTMSELRSRFQEGQGQNNLLGGLPLDETNVDDVKKTNEITGMPVRSRSSSCSSSSTTSEDCAEEGAGVLSPEREDAITEAEDYLKEFWQRRRELSMASGSLHGMIGICVGTALDILFTNTVLKNANKTCSN